MGKFSENEYYRPGYIPSPDLETDDYIEYHTGCRDEDKYAEQMISKGTTVQRLCDRFKLQRDIVIKYLEICRGCRFEPLEFRDCDYSITLLEFYQTAAHFGVFPAY